MICKSKTIVSERVFRELGLAPGIDTNIMHKDISDIIRNYRYLGNVIFSRSEASHIYCFVRDLARNLSVFADEPSFNLIREDLDGVISWLDTQIGIENKWALDTALLEKNPPGGKLNLLLRRFVQDGEEETFTASELKTVRDHFNELSQSLSSTDIPSFRKYKLYSDYLLGLVNDIDKQLTGIY